MLVNTFIKNLQFETLQCLFKPKRNSCPSKKALLWQPKDQDTLEQAMMNQQKNSDKLSRETN